MNGDYQLFDYIRDYATNYNKQKSAEIKSKVFFSSIISYTSIGLITICGIILIILFGRVQQRIWILMALFFRIDQKEKDLMYNSLLRYKT